MKFWVYFLSLSLASSVIASEPIVGAFGFQFGQTPELEQLEPLGSEEDAGDKYKVQAPNPYGLLENYFVYVTPSTGRIYQIQGLAEFESKTHCVAELNAIEDVLSNKYGEKVDDISAEISGIPTLRYRNEKSRIVGYCLSVLTPVELTITYIDDNLKEKAKKERASKTNSERDTSGL